MSTEFGTAAVNTAIMKTTAEGLFTAIKNYEDAVKDVQDLIEKSESFWESTSALAFRGTFRKEINAIVFGIYEMEKYPKELMEYFNVYSNVIKTNANRIDAINTIEMK